MEVIRYNGEMCIRDRSEADLAYQENELRNTRISMEQERLRLKQERIGVNKELTTRQRRYEQYERLMKEQLIAREDFLQAREEYMAAKEQLAVIDERIRQDNIFRESQITSLDENIRNMKRSLSLVRERIENLKVKAPIDGQVGNLDAQIGQSIAAGEHIGQIIDVYKRQVFLFKGREYFFAFIRRTVIDDNHFKLWVVLFKNGR